MIKTHAKRLFWLIATSEYMFIRLPAWRLLRLYESATGKDKTLDSKKKAPNASAEDATVDAAKKERLCHLYEATAKLRKVPPVSESSSFTPKSGHSKCAVILAPSLPKHDRNSSGLRIHCVLKALSPYFDSIYIVHHSISEDDPVYKRGYPANIQCHHIRLSSGKVEKFLASTQPDTLFVTDLFDPQYISKCAGIIKITKLELPDCFVILDTMATGKNMSAKPTHPVPAKTGMRRGTIWNWKNSYTLTRTYSL